MVSAASTHGHEAQESGRCYESVWGLRLVAARDGVQLYRGTAAYHHIVGLHRGPRPGLVRIVFDVSDREGVDALHRAISAAGGPVTAPARLAADGGGYGFGCLIRTAATSHSCARAPIMRTHRT